MTDDMRIARWKLLCEEALPMRARQQGWTIRLDHCFKRICLDFAFNDVWYHHLPKPAQRHLRGEALARALACAEELVQAIDDTLLRERNHASLRLRGKLHTRTALSAAEGTAR